MNTEIKKEVTREISNLGPSEYALAVSKVEDPNNVAAIMAAVADYRKQFESKHGVMSNGASAYATRDQWQAIARDADASARRELLKESALLSEVDELTRRADEAKRIADERTAELNRLWSEYSSLPDRISSTQLDLDSTNEAIKSLDPAELRKDYKDWFRSMLDIKSQVHPLVFAQRAEILITAELRREVLEEKASELEAQLVEMRKRIKQLSKQLGAK
jgi:chromosome segregation ATPase